jgi:hypothetical protein
LYSASVEKTTSSTQLNLFSARARTWSYYNIAGTQPQHTESDANEDIWRAGFEWRRGMLAGAALSAEYARENLEGVDHRNPA